VVVRAVDGTTDCDHEVMVATLTAISLSHHDTQVTQYRPITKVLLL